MPKISLKSRDFSPISDHFNTAEFFSKSSDAPSSHPFYSELVDAAEYLRNHYGVPWRITSTFRTEAEERSILNRLHVPFFVDVHMMGQAFDSQPAQNSPAVMADLTREFLGAGPVYQHLRQIGINGFGLYDTFIHLDVRTAKALHKDAFGMVAHWDSRRAPATASPWGVAFAGQKKSVAHSLLKQNPTPTLKRSVLTLLRPPFGGTLLAV